MSSEETTSTEVSTAVESVQPAVTEMPNTTDVDASPQPPVDNGPQESNTAKSIFGPQEEESAETPAPQTTSDNQDTPGNTFVQQRNAEHAAQTPGTQESQQAVQPNAATAAQSTPAIDPQQLAAVAQILQKNQQQQEAQQQGTVPPVGGQNAQAPVQPNQQQVPQQQAPLTEDQKDHLFNRVRVDESQFDAIFEGQDKQAAVNQLNQTLQATVNQAVTMALHLVNDAKSNILGAVQPYMTFADQQRDVMLENTFRQKFPQYEGMDVIIEQVKNQLISEQYRSESPEQLFSEIDKRAQGLIQALSTVSPAMAQQQQGVQQPGVQQMPVPQGGIPLQPGQGVPNQPPVGQPQQRTTNMSTLTTGGQGGVGQGSANAGQRKNTAKRIFG